MAELDVSVVLPAHNEEKLVGAAIASIAAQEWPLDRVEALVVSNGSTDRTAEAVAAAAAAHPELHVASLHEPLRGIGRAKNLGAANARGRLLFFLDADSRASPNAVRAIVEAHAAGTRIGTMRIVADGTDPLDHAFFWVIENGKRLFRIRANMLWCEAALFAELGGFDASLRHAEDRDLLVRAARAGLRVGHLRGAWIATSPRRLRRYPLRIGMLTMLARWALGHAGIGRRWPY